MANSEHSAIAEGISDQQYICVPEVIKYQRTLPVISGFSRAPHPCSLVDKLLTSETKDASFEDVLYYNDEVGRVAQLVRAYLLRR